MAIKYVPSCENSKYNQDAKNLYTKADFEPEYIDKVNVDDYFYGILNQKTLKNMEF